MAPALRHYSGRLLVLSQFCLFASLLQVTSVLPQGSDDQPTKLLNCSSFSAHGLYPPYPTKAPKCDLEIVSRPGGPQNGTFSAPQFANPAGHSRQCVYTFVGERRQRVEVVFTAFNLRGTPPDGSAAGVLPACVHEYIDVYSEVQQPKASELINSPFGGRFCGPIPPRRRISLYHVLALGFYTDKNTSFPELFEGRYAFINDSEYEVGTPEPNSPCNFTVHSTSKKTGVIVSPTYPGAYPKDLNCSYLFKGQMGQRIRLEFRDFDLFFGGPHCPFDYMKLYDGPDTNATVIGTYCGQQRNLVLYSSEAALLVTFVTIPRTANTQNRGFKGIFEFSESFVKLEFIGKNDSEHIRGSECDQKILSKKESSGWVYSPNYPFPYIPKIVCRYFIYGMQDSQHLERVRLEFHMFDIPRRHKEDCTDGYLKLYLKGQEATDSYDKFDHELCGDESKPSVVVSDGPRLVMVFSSGELQGRGFKAKYTFETEYLIPGTAAPDGRCSFTYRSTSKKRGDFNSPRYPSNYPSETNCTYLFLATPNEQVMLVFEHFKVRADNANTTSGAYGVHICQEDWLEIYNVYRDGTEKLIGRYCGQTAPGPVKSNRPAFGLKVILHSDQEGVFSGFKARYTFEDAKSVFGDCGDNVTNLDDGVIVSPKFPLNYDAPSKGISSLTCNWFINVRIKHKILLNFEVFAVEGDPAERGCPATVVRLWHTTDKPPLELCGEKRSTDKWQYLSEGNSMRISFIVSDKSVGAQGFRAVWTEVSEGPDCDQFLCAESSYCIAETLRCNRVANCGGDDSSDEVNCLVEGPVNTFTLSAVALCVAGAAVAALCAWCHHRKRRRRRRHLARLRRNAAGSSRRQPGSAAGSRRQHVCDELGERFASVDSV